MTKPVGAYSARHASVGIAPIRAGRRGCEAHKGRASEGAHAPVGTACLDLCGTRMAPHNGVTQHNGAVTVTRHRFDPTRQDRRPGMRTEL